MKNFVISGPSGSGRTSLIKEIIKRTDKKICGVFTEKFPDKTIDGYCPIYIYPAGGSPIFDDKHLIGLGGYCNHYINTEVFDSIGVELLNCDSKDSIIIIDEIGFLELKAEKFQQKVLSCLNGEIPCIVVMKQKMQYEFLQKIKALSLASDNTVFLEIKDNNWEECLDKILSECF